MADGVVDLRSDTVTRPSAGMRKAMAEAEVGDDVYGEDPTINRLERTVAEMVGHEAGLFVPSGSMGNQLGLRSLAKPGEEILCDATAHIARAELGAAAALSGITFRTWHGYPPGGMDTQWIRDEFATPNAGPHLVSTAAIAVENTHNFAGGVVMSSMHLLELGSLAHSLDIPIHLDGARIWNAHVASRIPLVELVAPFETASVCLSKGLGAPVGSVLISRPERIAEARVWRKRFGGGMRQAGILAAAGLYALEHNIARLADDHGRAQRLGEALPGARPVETNIVVFDVGAAPFVAAAAAAQGVLVSALGPRLMRLVTHLDVDDDGVDRAIEVLKPLLDSGGAP